MSNAGSRLAAGQSLGRRERQEDDFAMADLGSGADDCILLVVADGMGGHAGGAEAAQCATRRFLAIAGQPGTGIDTRLRPALDGANAAIADLTRGDDSLDGAGCTLVAAAIENDMLSWISVGDSSLLLLRDGELRKLNEDHSMRPVLADMVAAGRLSVADADRHPNRNALRSAVTGEELTLVDAGARPIALRAGDLVLLASDGLDVLDTASIARTLGAGGAATAKSSVDALLAAVEAAQRPRQDNTTVVLYAAPGMPPARTQKRRAPRVLIAFGIAFVLALAAVAAWQLRKQISKPAPAPHAQVHGPRTSISHPAAVQHRAGARK